jgi:hypothetical protein
MDEVDFDEQMAPWRALVRARTPALRRAAAAAALQQVAQVDPLAVPPSAQVLMVGDVHCNVHYLLPLIAWAAAGGHRTIVQLGDTFGTRLDTAEGAMDVLSRTCQAHQVTFLFIEGNHDRHVDGLDRLPVHPPSGLRPCRPNVWHVPRGFSWTWNGCRWAAIGGAVSVDAAQRIAGTSWWPEEEITDDEVDAMLRQVGQADVLLTHDRPAWVEAALGLVPGAWWERTPPHWADSDFHRSQAHQQRLDRLVAGLRPALHLHGHLHRRYTLVSDRTPWGGRCRVEGLAHEGMAPGNTLLLPVAPDLPALTATNFVTGLIE